MRKRVLILLLLFGICEALTSQAGSITNFAGAGIKGFSGDGGPAVNAQLNDPTGIARGPEGALYICDTGNHRIRKVTADGIIHTVAGTGEPGWSGDGGPATSAKLNEPYEVRFDSFGNVFWVERLSHSVRKSDAKTGLISTIAGTGVAGFSGDGGPAARAALNEPHSIGFDKAGDLYICDVKNHRIRKVEMRTGKISTFAGTGEKKAFAEGTPFRTAALHGPRALDFDRAGNLWVALREGNLVCELNLKAGTIHRKAGAGKKGFDGDGGPALTATFSGPKGIAVASSGKVYLADTENHSIRMIDPAAGTIHLIAGTGVRGDGHDNDPLKCQFARPHGIFVDADGSVFIGDSDANRVRVIRGY
jgi:DNA-binding beta-propeller fold protein YncE